LITKKFIDFCRVSIIHDIPVWFFIFNFFQDIFRNGLIKFRDCVSRINLKYSKLKKIIIGILSIPLLIIVSSHFGLNVFRVSLFTETNFQFVLNSALLHRVSIFFTIIAIIYFIIYAKSNLKKEFILPLVFILLSAMIINIPLQFIVLDGSTEWQWLFIKSLQITFLLPALYLSIHAMFRVFIKEKEILNLNILPFILSGIFLLIQIVQHFLQGPAFPRLEDEMAYFIQSLFFSEGVLMGKFPEVKDLFVIPYIIHKGDTFFSTHQHGFSYFITIFKFLGLIHFINSILTAANSLLLYALARKLKLSQKFSIFVQAFYLSIPLTYFLSRSYMSHHLAQFFLLLMLISWLAAYEKRKNIFTRNFALYSALFLISGLFLAFTRIQIFVVLIGSFLLSEAFYFFNLTRTKNLKNIAANDFSGALLICGLSLIAYISLKEYASLYNMNSLIFLRDYMSEYVNPGCQSLGWGEGKGCFYTYGTMGHTFLKVLLNMTSFLFSFNNVLSPLYLPVFAAGIYLIYKEKTAIFSNEKFLLILITPFIQLFLHGLYFHNGSENYFGRYLYESAPLLFIVFAGAAEFYFERKKVTIYFFRHTAAAGMFIVILMALFSNHGDYTGFKPDISELRKIQNSLILIQDDTLDLVTPDEYNPGKDFVMPAEKARYIVNFHYGEILSLQLFEYKKGYFRDENGNYIFPTNISADRARELAGLLGLKNIYLFKIVLPDYKKINKNIKIQFPKKLIEINNADYVF